MTEAPSIRLSHAEYTVGWVCALPKEQAAAFYMLEDKHEDLPNPPNDYNAYILGSISKHNIVIAYLPMGRIGNNNSATVAARMVSTFPNIKVGLMVGIGGGMPQNNVRLGDVVVSCPKNADPGVVQWDMGKTEEGGKFKRTGSLNNPPTALLTALNKFESNPAGSRTKMLNYLNHLKTQDDIPASFTKSDLLKDVLYKSTYSHISKSSNFDDDDDAWENEIASEVDDCRLCDENMIVKRSPREDTMIHYGLIASGNQVIKDASFRNKLNKDFNGSVLCVEMEAAGLMNDFPCIVIRGICDYADSHKNKAWQEYAAAVAAAYVKALLTVLPVGDVNKMQTIQDLLPPGFVESVKQCISPFWGDKEDRATGASATPYNTQPEGVGENQSHQEPSTQAEKPADDSAGPQPRDINHDQNPSRRSCQQSESLSQEAPSTDSNIEPGMENSNIAGQHVDYDKAIKLLLENGSNAAVTNKERCALLTRASSKGHIGAVQLLLVTSGAVLISEEDEHGRTALSWAAANGHKAVVQVLLDTSKIGIASRDKTGRTPLQWAAERGHGDVVQLLLEKGAKPECRRTLEGHRRDIYSVVFSHDSKLVVSGADDNTIKIWDIATGQCLLTLQGHSGRVESVALSHDARRVASGGGDCTVKLWDTATGQCLQTLQGHKARIFSVAFSHDSKLLASGG